MKSFICLLLTLSVAYGAILPAKPRNCLTVMCTMVFLTCPDGTPAPVPIDGCCPSLSACRQVAVSGRSNPLSSLGSLLSGSNLLQSLSTATHGTNLGTVMSILNLLNNVNQLSTDIHQIPQVINETLAHILNGTGQATQVIIDQLIGAVTGLTHQAGTGRDLLSVLGHNANLLTSVSKLLPKGTSISTVMSILNLLNNINALNQDIHHIPAVLNQTLASIVGGAGEAGQVIIQQLMGLIGGGHSQGTGRDLLGVLGHNANLLSSVSKLLPQGTSISTVLSILKLLGNVNALNKDIHQIPAVINETLGHIFEGAGQAGQVIVQQLLGLVGIQSHNTGRDLLSVLGNNANLLSTVSHLLPQGTSISTVLSILKLLGNVSALNNDVHQIPTVLQETVQSILQSIQNVLPPTIQPVQGSS